MDYPHHELEEHCYRSNAIIAWLQGWSKLQFFWLEDSKDFPEKVMMSPIPLKFFRSFLECMGAGVGAKGRQIF